MQFLDLNVKNDIFMIEIFIEIWNMIVKFDKKLYKKSYIIFIFYEKNETYKSLYKL